MLSDERRHQVDSFREELGEMSKFIKVGIDKMREIDHLQKQMDGFVRSAEFLNNDTNDFSLRFVRMTGCSVVTVIDTPSLVISDLEFNDMRDLMAAFFTKKSTELAKKIDALYGDLRQMNSHDEEDGDG